MVPAHPAELLKSLTNGEAEIECLVTAEGKVTEARVLSASHPRFGEAALEAARQWEFRPGARGGVPVAMRVHVPFAFEISPDQALEIMAGHPLHEEVKETIVPAAQLPSWPSPKKILLPRYPASLKGSGKYGKAVVAIVINKEGRVIRPRIVKYTHEEFIWPALVTAASLQFEPIKAGKEPIYVSMELQYDFKADADKPKDEVKPAAEKKSKPEKIVSVASGAS
ncbi:MAG: TonB family protein [Opitutae bacterium]|nr:TonB family protein [Opitutae bacterium]